MTLAREAYQLRKKNQAIPGSTKEDQEVINQANRVRLRAIEAIRNALGLV